MPKNPDAQAAVTCTSVGGRCGNIMASGEEEISGTWPDCATLDAHCYRLSAVTPPVTPPPGAPGGATPATPVAQGSILLPPCTKTGNCSVDDIVNTGVSFANFLFGLSGALFFAIFIYGGARYLLSFGSEKGVKAGKDAIKGAAIGMVLVMGAWTIVRYVAGTVAPEYFLKGQGPAASGQKKTCEQVIVGGSCQSFAGATAPEVMSAAQQAGLKCQTGYCSGDFHNICCGPK